MESLKSSIGEISSKISWRPDFAETSSPFPRRAATVSSHFSSPISQWKLSVCRARRGGTSIGSLIFANEVRFVEKVLPAELRAAKSRPSNKLEG